MYGGCRLRVRAGVLPPLRHSRSGLRILNLHGSNRRALPAPPTVTDEQIDGVVDP